MAYRLTITGLANKHELLKQDSKAYRLYKFALSEPPDGFWVLMLQSAGRDIQDVTLSANQGHLELWASANKAVSVTRVLEAAKGAVRQANSQASDSEEEYKRAAAEAEAAKAEMEERWARAERERAAELAGYEQQLVAEIDDLSFEDPKDP